MTPYTPATAATSAVAWNPAGTQIATGNDDGTLRLFDATTQAPDRRPRYDTGDFGHVGGGVEPGRHPDRHRQRRRHAAAVRCHHPGTRSATPYDTGDASTSAVAWNPAGTQIATGNYDGTLRLFDATTQAPDR